MDNDFYEAIMEKEWDYRQCSGPDGNWQIYISEGLWHIATVKKESLARLIVSLANQNRNSVKQIITILKTIDL